MQDYSTRTYHGDGENHYEALDNAWTRKETYLADEDLVNAVNTALYLRRPLLLEGEPGCGKTQLAYAVAYEFGYPLKTCYIRSTTRAQDLLYTYDAVRRLYDIQESKIGGSKGGLPPRRQYYHPGELGEALELSQ